MAETKPLWGWRETRGDYGLDKKLPDEFLDALARNLGIKKHPNLADFKMHVWFAVDAFYQRRATYPSQYQIRAAVIETTKACRSLAVILEQLDDISVRFLNNQILEDTRPKANSPDRTKTARRRFWPSEMGKLHSNLRPLDVIKSALTDLESGGDNLLKKMSMGKRGRKPNRALEDLIGWLASAWEKVDLSPVDKLSYDVKTRRYSSPFFDFVSQVFAQIEHGHTDMNNALGEAIRRYFGRK